MAVLCRPQITNQNEIIDYSCLARGYPLRKMRDMGLDESLVKWMVSFNVMAVLSVIMSADKTADPWIVASMHIVGDSFRTPLLESL